MILEPKRRYQQAKQSLNDRVEIWKPDMETVTDKLGSDKQVPGLYDTVWANVEMIRGREETENGKVYPYAFYRVIIRYRDDLTPDMYLVLNGSHYNIDSIKNQYENRLFLELTATERVMAHGKRR